MDAAALPIKIQIASPCNARWEDMAGDERVRFCKCCSKNVYNLSSMSDTEARALIDLKQDDLCARVYRRRDGTILTKDCPVGLERKRRKARTLLAAGLAAVPLMVAWLLMPERDSGQQDFAKSLDHLVEQLEDGTLGVADWFGFGRTMGKIAPAPTPSSRSTSVSQPASSPASVNAANQE